MTPAMSASDGGTPSGVDRILNSARVKSAGGSRVNGEPLPRPRPSAPWHVTQKVA